MSTMRSVAQELFDTFLADGAFNVSCNSPADAGDNFLPASSSRDSNWVHYDIDFANMVVQAIGYEEGAEEKEGAVYVYSSKGSDKVLGKIAKTKDGIPIRVRRLSSISIKPEYSQRVTNSPRVFLDTHERVTCGSSCALSNVMSAGTLGALLKIPGDDTLYILSNNHVIGGCNHSPKGSIIMSPAPLDSTMGIAPHEVGRLEFVSPMYSGHPDFVKPCEIDAALAKVTYPDILTSWQGSLNDGYDTPPITSHLKTGMAVKKIGRTTGLTHGIVESKIFQYVKLPYKSEGFSATVYFSNFWVVVGNDNSPFASAGDSGSLVVTEDGTMAVGLVFASEVRGIRAWILPLTSILKMFGGAELVSQYGVPSIAGKSDSASDTP